MVVLNKGGDGGYLSHAARQLLEQNADFQKQKLEEEKQKQEEAERLRRERMAGKPKMTRWIPPSSRGSQQQQQQSTQNTNDSDKKE